MYTSLLQHSAFLNLHFAPSFSVHCAQSQSGALSPTHHPKWDCNLDREANIRSRGRRKEETEVEEEETQEDTETQEEEAGTQSAAETEGKVEEKRESEKENGQVMEQDEH